MMSRLWDTPEFWARSEADELLRDYPNSDARALAMSFERSSGNYDGDPAFARDIIAELRKRADAGVRFWPAPALGSLENEVRDALAAAGVSPSARNDEREAFWWQRM